MIKPRRPLVAGTLGMVGLAVGVLGCGPGAGPNRSRAPSINVGTGPVAAVDTLIGAGQFNAAVTRLETLRDSLAQAGDSVRLWQVELRRGDTRYRLGRGDSALTILRSALVLAGADPARRGWTFVTLARVYDNRGAFDSAFALSFGAESLARVADDHRLIPRAHYELGRLYSLTGRHRQAYAQHLAALDELRRMDPSSRDVAQALNEIAIDYKNLGRLNDAVASYQEAIRIDRALGQKAQLLLALGNLGEVYLLVADLDRARAVLTESYTLFPEVQDIRYKTFTLADLGDLYLAAGNLAAARTYLLQALELNQTRNYPYGIAVNLIELGKLAVTEGDLAAADTLLERARRLADSLGYRTEGAGVRVALSRAALAHHDARGALRWADAAVAAADSLEDPAIAIKAREARAAALEAAGGQGPRGGGKALASYREAIDLLESWRGRLAVGDLKMGVSDPELGIYEGAIRTLLMSQDPAGALSVAERARTRLLLELMALRERAHEGADPIDRLRDSLRDRYAELSSASTDDRVAIDRGIDRIGRSLDSLEASARARDPAAAPRYPTTAALEQIRPALLGAADAAMVEYFWGDQSVYGWWVTRDSIRIARLGASDSLATDVEFFETVLAQATAPDDSTWRSVGRRLYRLLVAPLAPTSASDIAVIPDGPLARIPFEALMAPGASRPLGATARIRYGPSAAVLLALARAEPAGARARSLLAVGNPTLGTGGGADSPDLFRGGHAGLGPLPFAEEEVRTLGSLFREGGADLLVGRDATPQRWLGLDPGRYRYLHFATHAQYDDRRPALTRILLTGGELAVPAISRLSLRSDLVTLSACGTALGKRVRGEGVIGLPYAFLAAGARGVVVTLWRVEDRPTRDFISAFYRRLKAGEPPADALRGVKAEWINGGSDHSAPHLWAPFILVGAR